MTTITLLLVQVLEDQYRLYDYQKKGKWWKSSDFPKTIWNLKKWMWLPLFRFFGFFRLIYYRHIGILSGVGVGGGSLVYANTLPIPIHSFYTSKSWKHLANWEEELKEFYPIKLKMLGADWNPRMELGDIALQELAKDLNKEDEFKATNVSIFFGNPGETVPESVF